MSKRVVHHADAIEWLKINDISGYSIVTSLPDRSEFPKWTLEQWKTWFVETAALVMSKCDPNAVAIFYQTDVKRDGIWVDKAFLCQLAAQKTGVELIAHKIVCRAPVGVDTHTKPGYSHLLCFSKQPLPNIQKHLADVLPEAGATTWTRGMGALACKLACEMVKSYTTTTAILDPFCGHGSVLAAANELGLDAMGIDHKLKYAAIAQRL